PCLEARVERIVADVTELRDERPGDQDGGDQSEPECDQRLAPDAADGEAGRIAVDGVGLDRLGDGGHDVTSSGAGSVEGWGVSAARGRRRRHSASTPMPPRMVSMTSAPTR